MHELLTKPNEWQYLDESCGLLFAWYTKPFLDVLKTIDVSQKNVLELGMGGSTLWWANRCKSLVAVDDHDDWFRIVQEGLIEKGLIEKTNLIKAVNKSDYMQPLFNGMKYDIIIVDGSYRMDCMQAINETNIVQGGMVILDNFEYTPEVMELPLCRTNNLHIYAQPFHYMWRTAYWQMDNFEIMSDNHALNSQNQKVRRNML